MNRYEIMKELGSGAYGSVMLMRTKESGELVADKKMTKKYYSWAECVSLREIQSLKDMDHVNIVKLKEVVREKNELHLIFEYMQGNLYDVMKERTRPFAPLVVRNIIHQVLSGLAYIHKFGYFHRDMKPENLLCNGTDLVKIADFGLAREIDSKPPYTDYVSTRWYRAPEVLLRAPYNAAVDIWALACIMVELINLRPLFPGSSEIDQINKIVSVLGTPTVEAWPDAQKLANAMHFHFPQMVPMSLHSIVPQCPPAGLDLLKAILVWNPNKRPSCAQALKLRYFSEGGPIPIPPPNIALSSVIALSTEPLKGDSGIVADRNAAYASIAAKAAPAQGNFYEESTPSQQGSAPRVRGHQRRNSEIHAGSGHHYNRAVPKSTYVVPDVSSASRPPHASKYVPVDDFLPPAAAFASPVRYNQYAKPAAPAAVKDERKPSDVELPAIKGATRSDPVNRRSTWFAKYVGK